MGFRLPHAILRFVMTGRDFTEYLMKMLKVPSRMGAEDDAVLEYFRQL
jgi:actin-related protein